VRCIINIYWFSTSILDMIHCSITEKSPVITRRIFLMFPHSIQFQLCQPPKSVKSRFRLCKVTEKTQRSDAQKQHEYHEEGKKWSLRNKVTQYLFVWQTPTSWFFNAFQTWFVDCIPKIYLFDSLVSCWTIFIGYTLWHYHIQVLY
jgi:hypothetical protein